MAYTKITKKDNFATVIAIVEASKAENKADLLAFLNHEVELLDKKAGKTKATPTHAANAVILDVIKEVLGGLDKPVTITELLTDARLQSYTETTKDGDKVIAMTNQKLSSLVKKLVDAKEVVRTEEKKKAYFSLAVVEEEETTEEESADTVEDEGTDDDNQYLDREVRA